MIRADFIRASVSALAGLSVRQLTDGHDEYLFDREIEQPESAAYPDPVTIEVVDGHGAVVASLDMPGRIDQDGVHVPYPGRLHFENTSGDVTVQDVRARWGDRLTVSMGTAARLPLVLHRKDALEVTVPTKLVTFSYS